MLYTNVGDMSIEVLPLVSAKMFFGLPCFPVYH